MELGAAIEAPVAGAILLGPFAVGVARILHQHRAVRAAEAARDAAGVGMGAVDMVRVGRRAAGAGASPREAHGGRRRAGRPPAVVVPAFPAALSAPAGLPGDVGPAAGGPRDVVDGIGRACFGGRARRAALEELGLELVRCLEPRGHGSTRLCWDPWSIRVAGAGCACLGLGVDRDGGVYVLQAQIALTGGEARPSAGPHSICIAHARTA